ncbi:MAG: PHB depolymerase family esterase [Candidatus Neomarinimicrobiota bacterium]|nr:PHB depolymerase family esterase [Candidatus Neomarinimicrobiota bacterium]
MLYIPQSAEKNSPLVFMLHGLGSTHTIIMNYSHMNQVADKHGFVVCYPQGIRGAENTRHTKKGTPFWNVGYETHKNETVDDVSFIKSLAIYLQQEYNLDPEKTFCAGMSNGGDMSYLLGCEAPYIFKAIAPITGCMMGWIYDSCNKNDPVPVFQVHGTADKTTYYDGDVDNRDKWGVYMGVETTINFWVDRNECKEINIDTLPDIDRNDGSIVITEKYTGGRNNNEVWFYKVINGDHEWPPGWPVKSGNGDLNTSEEIWKFFQHCMNQRES